VTKRAALLNTTVSYEVRSRFPRLRQMLKQTVLRAVRVKSEEVVFRLC